MAIIRYKPDPTQPFRFSAEERARLAAMTEDEIEANAASDPDNPPWTEEELARGAASRLARLTREATGLSQPQFAEAYQINLARLRDLEQGRSAGDSALLAYLKVIHADPERVRAVLAPQAA